MDNMSKILLSICFILLFYVVLFTIHHHEEYDNACKELGLEISISESNTNLDYCEDIDGNLHYVKFECKNLFWEKCIAKPISVGDVRTIQIP